MPKKETVRRTKLVSFDFAIKYLLRNKSNFVIIEGFLSELLKLKEGLKKGKEETKREIALEIKKSGMDIKIIAQITGLGEEEIKQLN